MTPEKRKEYKDHFNVWKKYAKEGIAWLKEVDAITVTDAGGTIPPPPPPPGGDNPPGKPPNP